MGITIMKWKVVVFFIVCCMWAANWLDEHEHGGEQGAEDGTSRMKSKY